MTDENTPPPKTPRQRRWLMPLLVVSVAANLLVVGVIAGSILSDDGPRKRGGSEDRAARGVIGEPFFRALPADDRRAMARDIIGQRDKFRESRRELQTRFENFLTALRAEDFDRDTVAALLGQQRNAAIQRQELGERLLLDRLEQMTAAERATYADTLEEKLKGLRRR